MVLRKEQSTGKHFFHPCWLKGMVVFVDRLNEGAQNLPWVI